ncbi:permease prefix domain 1-containing protein [Vagococcus elongatus]|uniref:Beta-carotene 15,15'-monooxygenase n=1 Tax=Vagococcus elongatus TaxID=180344 RepID=A0A430ART3_9ENTE|nr:permease prefix domain 1-containing protein [Vagococcus elongatus]RSU10757.1 hypothetical protein CBF29_09240 [Vagococcus elongatus]
MDTIKNYVETMFINLPETPEMMQLKVDILANMEDKFEELIGEGMSENAAIGQVISEFGNIEEVLEEFNIRDEDEQDELSEEVLPTIDSHEVEKIMTAKRGVGLKVGLGVMACCAGVGILVGSNANGNQGIGLAGLFLMAAVGVALFILGGFQNSKYEYLEKPFVMTGGTRREVEKQKQAFEKSFIVSITLGVVLCILSVIPLIVTAINEGGEIYEQRMVTIMFFIASLGVFLFIYAGVIQGTYTLLLEKGLMKQPTAKELKKSKLASKIDAVFWPIVVVIFFIWGFVFDGFGISWIVFPIAAVLSNIWDPD